MKTLIIAIAIVLSACADSPNIPSPEVPKNEQGLYNPPPPGGVLAGTWYDRWGARLTQSGIYDPNIPATLTGDIRVSGNWVWFDLYGGGHKRLYSGVITGDQIVGYEELSNWTPSQGITQRGTPKPFNWTRAK